MLGVDPGEVTANLTYPGVGFGGKVFMQDFTSSDCNSSIATNTQGTLIDLRDNNVYWVARLKDGNCWMTQDLAYADPKSSTGWSNTDNARVYRNSGVNTKYSGIIITADELDEAQRIWFYTSDENFLGATSYTSADGKMICSKTANSWKGDIASDYIPCRMYTIPQNATYTHDETLHGSTKYGYYYSYQSATNGTGSSVTTTDAVGSICPNSSYNKDNGTSVRLDSWKLPTSGQYTTLLSGLGTGSAWSSAIRSAPYYFQMGGYVGSGSLTNAGSGGYYWSSTAKDSSGAYELLFTSNAVIPSNGGNTNFRYIGHSVRCLVLGS